MTRDQGFFDPSPGDSPLFYEHFLWAIGGPELFALLGVAAVAAAVWTATRLCGRRAPGREGWLAAHPPFLWAVTGALLGGGAVWAGLASARNALSAYRDTYTVVGVQTTALGGAAALLGIAALLQLFPAVVGRRIPRGPALAHWALAAVGLAAGYLGALRLSMVWDGRAYIDPDAPRSAALDAALAFWVGANHFAAGPLTAAAASLPALLIYAAVFGRPVAAGPRDGRSAGPRDTSGDTR